MASPPWYKSRRYLHFDAPVGPRRASAVATKPAEVARHAFYPFLYTERTTIKVSRDPVTKKREKKKKVRPICYAAHMDSHIYAYYAWKLGQDYENALKARGIDECVLAFRSLGKSNVDFALEAFAAIRASAPCHVIAIDIKGFFDNLDHDILKKQWCALLGSSRLPADHYRIYESLTSWCSADKKEVFKAFGISVHNPKSGKRKRICSPQDFREKVRNADLLKLNETAVGIPQGSPISAVLSNIYMMELDEEMNRAAKQCRGVYFRYCDDILLIAPAETKTILYEELRRLVAAAKLTIQEKKTEERQFVSEDDGVRRDQTLQYLGFVFDGKNIRIRESSLCRYHERMSKGVWVAERARLKRNKYRENKGFEPKPLYLKKLYKRYSYLGRRNFMSYGYRAATTMSSSSIRRQLIRLTVRFRKRLEAAQQ